MTGAVPDGLASTDTASALAHLRERGWTLGIAESLTGGMLAAELISVPGASATVLGGVVAYATPLKQTLLRVDAALLADRGPVDPDVACQMADGARLAVAVDGRPADVGISTTGIAGPESPDGQPVGTVYIGVSTPRGTTALALRLEGDRQAIRAETVRRAVAALLTV